MGVLEAARHCRERRSGGAVEIDPPAPASAMVGWWRGRILSMPGDPPAGVPAFWWGAIRSVSIPFLERWGAQAEALGWTAGDLFAVDSGKPWERVDAWGLCPLLAARPGRSVAALTASGAVIATGRHRTSFQRRQAMPGATLVWALWMETVSDE